MSSGRLGNIRYWVLLLSSRRKNQKSTRLPRQSNGEMRLSNSAPAIETKRIAAAITLRRTIGTFFIDSLLLFSSLSVNRKNTARINAAACPAKAQNAKRQSPKVEKPPPISGPQNDETLQTAEMRAMSRGINSWGNTSVQCNKRHCDYSSTP